MSDSVTLPLSDSLQQSGLSKNNASFAPGDPLPAWVFADLRTDHAGEVGAVCIYQGVLRFSRDPALRVFALHHLATEQKHLSLISEWLPVKEHSHLLPLWRLSGFLTGALPALFGKAVVYATIEAVETFVDHHYSEQIQALSPHPALNELRQTLIRCRADEVAHRDEASAAYGSEKRSVFLRIWCAMVGSGSRAAVALIRHI
jgi:3-demethoxyubiquinol 3-hydroxylase